jgi:hypothetical protein
MNIKSSDRRSLETLWESNERELLRLAVMSPVDREFHAKREDELLDEQDAIEFQLGFAMNRILSLAPMVRHDGLEVGP